MDNQIKLIKRKNKKAQLGSESIIWIYRLIVLSLVIAAYALIIFKFYSTNYDVREAEASLLSQRITNCLAEQGIVSLEKFTNENLVKCINADSNRIYARATLIYSNTTKINFGNMVLAPLCGIKGKDAPFCMNKKYYVIVDKNNKFEKAAIDLLIALPNENG